MPGSRLVYASEYGVHDGWSDDLPYWAHVSVVLDYLTFLLIS